MSGEVEEPFSFNFQVGSIHSGSISFGRFETESLCWERRSSFSHNRYLEEIEKCSKPGLVIEKKAYFEAHFRKKALLRQTASEDQSGTEYENVNEGSSFSGSDMSHDSADNPQVCQVIDVAVEGDFKDDKTLEEKEILIEETITADEIRLDRAKLNMEVKEILIEEKVNVEYECGLSESFHVGRAAEKQVTSSERQCTSPKLMSATENKFIKSKSKSQVNVTRSQRNFSKTPCGDFEKDSGLPERLQITRVAKRVQHPLQPAQRATRTDVSRMEKAKLTHENKSVNSTKKVCECNLKKDDIGSCERHKQIGKSSKAVTTFKDEEWAERRKEAKTEAEAKQLRKSLNFKAVPMPSFYHEAAQPRLDKKLSIICTKSNKILSKSSSSRRGTDTGPSAYQNEDQTVSINGSINESGTPQVSSLTNCSISAASPDKGNNFTQVAMKIKVAVKKDQRNDMNKCMHKNQVAKANKTVIKGLSVEKNLNTESTRSSSQIGRKKETKGGVSGSQSENVK